jgi:hypothetical protein
MTYTDTFRSRFSEAASGERTGDAQQQMSATNGLGPTNTLWLDFEANLRVFIPTLIYIRVCFMKPLAARARKLHSRLLACLLGHRGWSWDILGISLKTVYSALQSALAWVVYGFLLDGELLIGSYSITFLLVQIFEYPVSLSLINMTRDFRVLFLEKVESA